MAEFELLASGRQLIGENSSGARLHAETLDRDVWDPDLDPICAGIASLVAVHRLREVSCLYGFTRFEPAPLVEDELEDVSLAVEGRMRHFGLLVGAALGEPFGATLPLAVTDPMDVLPGGVR